MIFKINRNTIVYLVAIFVFICTSFIYYNNSCAFNNGNVFLSSDKSNIDKDGEFEVIVNLENNETSAFTSYLYFDTSKVEFISGPENINLIDNHIIYVWYDETGKDNAKQGEIAKFKFKAKDDGIANFVIDGEFYSSIGQLMEINFKQLQVQIGNSQTIAIQMEENEDIGTDTKINNANLKVLRLNKEGMVPSFQKDVYEYYLSVLNDVNNIEVLAIADNSNAIVEIVGNSDLKEGVNDIRIKVTSEDRKQSNTYVIHVTKTSDLELANTNLEILAIENVLLYPQFDASVTNYNVEVSNTISSLNVLAIPENQNAVVEISGKDDLKVGDNFINVSVTATDGFSRRVYKVDVYRRNLEEENKYQEELKTNQEALEDIYETEKTKSDIENGNSKNEKFTKMQMKKLVGVIIVLGIFLLASYFLLIYRFKKF